VSLPVPSMRPYAIPHDQHGAGLRDYFVVDFETKRDPLVVWIVLVLVAFALGYGLGATR
jgi:hypothetical protein